MDCIIPPLSISIPCRCSACMPILDAKLQKTILGLIVLPLSQAFLAPLLVLGCMAADMYEGVCWVAPLPGLHALGLLAPGALADAALLLAPAPSVWMIHRVHGNTTRLYTASHLSSFPMAVVGSTAACIARSGLPTCITERWLSWCVHRPRCSPQAVSLPIWMRQPCQPSCSCAAGWTGHRRWRCSSPAPASACQRAALPLHSHQSLHPANPSLTVTTGRAHRRARQPSVALLTHSLSLHGNT